METVDIGCLPILDEIITIKSDGRLRNSVYRKN